MKHQSQRGVALVITLIMLSVITFLTVAFLAVTRRDRASVTQSLNQTDSHLMADTALARFQAELVSGMIARGTLGDYELMLTRNYIRVGGYTNQPLDQYDTNNVNYDYQDVGGPLSNDQRIRNIANLYFDPRPPVYARNADGTTEFRFYLDYNRNGRFETNGFLPVVIDEVGNVLKDAGGNVVSNFFTGEPEWIGVLQNPELPHGPNNRFVGRYLYLALPIGKTLDWNYIHNYAKGDFADGYTANMPRDGFLRNQGFGSYEINLAGFLVDLNTNMYVNNAVATYQYFPDPSFNMGDVFNDAASFLKYRYGGDFYNLASVNTLFGGVGQTAFQNDFIDGYSTRPVLTAPFVNTADPDIPPVAPQDLTTQPWSGADNKARFINPQELFDPAKSSPNFVSQLQRVSTNNNSFDRYTFQRLLEQIGMGSEPEVKGKININYVNDPTLNTANTNFVEWTPIQFFTNVAARLIRDNLVHPTNANGTVNTNVFYIFNTTNAANLVRPNFNFDNIQIYPTNEYTAPVHRLLQLAANVYDATTSNRFPTIFRPQFGVSGNQTNIVSFVAETNTLFITNSLSSGFQERSAISNFNGFVWGVPLVVGAKKGFPSFHKFVAQTSVQVSRNLQIKKKDSSETVVLQATNQLLFLGISNTFGVSLWNSYQQVYPNPVRILMTNMALISVTNKIGTIIWPANGVPLAYRGPSVNLITNQWAPAPYANAFIYPIGTNYFTFLTNAQYTSTGFKIKAGFVNPVFDDPNNYPLPEWGFTMNNRLVCMVIDLVEQRVIDFVNVDGMSTALNISKELLGEDYARPGLAGSPVESVWKTNRIGGDSVPTLGITNQILISMGVTKVNQEDWTSYNLSTPNGPQKDEAIATFYKFMGFTPLPPYDKMAMPTTRAMQTPFNPTRKIDQTAVWEINDPLVHYTVEDLRSSTNVVNQPRIPPDGPPLKIYLDQISNRYQPWGGNHPPGQAGQDLSSDSDPLAYDWRIKDPRVRQSDDWDFPTNKFPSIGWLGRVHRGTPWQTIYLKADAAGSTNWLAWASHHESHPTNDWKLMDVFTASPNDNSARGLLSVNQTNLAAWSAALSGIVVLKNNLTDKQAVANESGTAQFESIVVQPNSPTLSQILNDINSTRTNFAGTYGSLGQILATPSLSIGLINIGLPTETLAASPFLNISSPEQLHYGLTDEAVERIPRQIMSLLKLGEARYVVYCYGQSLKPANNSLVLSAPAGSGLFNLCTNYQITGEVLTRSLLRVEGTPQNPRTVIENYNILPAD